MSSSKLILPLIHLGGTSPITLMEDYSAARTALVDTRPAHMTTVSQPVKAREASSLSAKSHRVQRTPSAEKGARDL